MIIGSRVPHFAVVKLPHLGQVMIYLSIYSRSSSSSPVVVRGCLCRIRLTGQIQPGKHVLCADDGDYTAPTRQHEVDDTEHARYKGEMYVLRRW